ncbi:MFS general substrate transporter [Xylaria intraflava]|nr:MFS general substrate transporter [Xylaria intraflava]
MDEKTPIEAVSASASSSDLDETYVAYKQQGGQEIDPQESRQVLRAIDFHLLPFLAGTYLLQYLDKISINSASVFGLQAGTGLHGQQFAWLTSLFYLGYLVAQPVAGYALQRFPLGKFIGITVLIWGVLLITTPACTNFAGIGASRFLLGVFESAVNPGFILIISMWYVADEQPLRTMIYYCMNGFASIFGGLLGYAIGHITTGLPPWKYVFLIYGALSLTWSAIWLVFMPDLPTTARFLNDRQKIVALERVVRNRQGVKNHNFKTYQMWQCLRDPKTWILFIMSIAAQIPNSAGSSFMSIILQSFGFSSLETQYWQIPSGVVQVVSLLISGYIGSRFPNTRCAVMLAGNIICVAASGALVGLPSGPDGTENKWGRLVALWLCSCQSVGFSMSLTMVSGNVAGYTKKQMTGAIVFVGYCVGNDSAYLEAKPSMVSGDESTELTPHVRITDVAMLIGYSVKTVMVIALYLYMWSANKKRDREAAAGGPELAAEREKNAIEQGMQDVTELDNPGFRYLL